MYHISLKSILNEVQPIKGFKYESSRWSKIHSGAIEVALSHRQGCKGVCSGCGQPGTTYDHLPARTWQMPPMWSFPLVLIYAARRIDCPDCGVKVEKLPWASGKRSLTDSCRLFLAHWARKLSWLEVAKSFGFSWFDVYSSVSWVVEYGKKNRCLKDVISVGVDEICVRAGRVYWTLIYQIDAHMVRLLWVGHDRTGDTLIRGFDELGEQVCSSVRFICSDMWQPYLAAVRIHMESVMHILDRFHIRKQLNEAINDVRKEEARALAEAGLDPKLKHLRWALLKNRKNWTPKERKRMRQLANSGMASLRAYWLVASFEHFWTYVSPTWAGKFLDAWCEKIQRSKLQPLKTVAKSLRQNRELLLNYFRAKKAISNGIVEGLNNAAKLTFRKSFGFRTDEAREVALFHALGKLPEPPITHKFF